MWTIDVNVNGVVRKMDTLAENAADLSPSLSRIGGYLKAEAKRKYEAQAFAPLAQSTLAHRASRGIQSLESKLGIDYRKAKRRAHDALRGGQPRGQIASLLAKITLSDAVARTAVAQTRGVRNRLAVLEEFRRRHRGGAGGRVLTAAQTKSLNAREARAISKQVNKPILGGLDRTLMFKVASGSVTMRSATYANFSEVHNKGGIAGHGAREPARPTVELDEMDLTIFKAILVEDLMIGVGG